MYTYTFVNTCARIYKLEAYWKAQADNASLGGMEIHILKEIAHVANFVQGSSETSSSLLTKLAVSMQAQINAIPLVNTKLASELKEAVLASSYLEKDKVALNQVIEHKLVCGIEVSPAARSSQKIKNQKLHAQLPSFVTDEDIAFFKSNATFERKQQRLVDRMQALGVVGADEWTHAYCLGLLLLLHFPKMPKEDP